MSPILETQRLLTLQTWTWLETLSLLTCLMQVETLTVLENPLLEIESISSRILLTESA
jgi:hypothetical protein